MNLPYAPQEDSLKFLSGSEAYEIIEGDTEIGIVVVPHVSFSQLDEMATLSTYLEHQ